METTQVSEHGQVMLPEFIRNAHKWELIILNIGKGIFLTPKAFFETTRLFEPTTLDEVAGCLKYRGKAKTSEEMENAIADGVRKRMSVAIDTNIVVRFLTQDDEQQYQQAYDAIHLKKELQLLII